MNRHFAIWVVAGALALGLSGCLWETEDEDEDAGPGGTIAGGGSGTFPGFTGGGISLPGFTGGSGSATGLIGGGVGSTAGGFLRILSDGGVEGGGD